MKVLKFDFWGRKKEIDYLKTYYQTPGSGLMYVRGRRRVGKSWLLRKFANQYKNAFYFTGTVDSSNESCMIDFCKAWDQFALSQLSFLKTEVLNWQFIFKDINTYAKKEKYPVILIFDEIQWIAKTGSGFVGRLKEAWVDWEQTQNIKIILCGSSNKFFHQYQEGENKVLRGLKTFATLWVKPFNLDEVNKYYFSKWKLEEVALTYMMLGGIPYYLSQLQTNLGFIHCINQAVFTQKSIFLEEVDEILSLDFNKAGKETIKKILASIGQKGTSQAKIVEKTGLSSSTISDAVEKLVDYQILFPKLPAHKKPSKKVTYSYFMKDFFLNFYFQIIEPLQKRIEKNQTGLLFPYSCLSSNTGYYIPNFSGEAFELLVRTILEERDIHQHSIFKKLNILDENYEVLTYWDQTSQIDLLVEHNKDRQLRLLECKWLSQPITIDSYRYFEEILKKKFPIYSYQSISYYLILSQGWSKGFEQEAYKWGIGLIGLESLFDYHPQK